MINPWSPLVMCYCFETIYVYRLPWKSCKRFFWNLQQLIACFPAACKRDKKYSVSHFRKTVGVVFQITRDPKIMTYQRYARLFHKTMADILWVKSRKKMSVEGASPNKSKPFGIVDIIVPNSIFIIGLSVCLRRTRRLGVSMLISRLCCSHVWHKVLISSNSW